MQVIKILEVNTELFPDLYIEEGLISGYTLRFQHTNGKEYLYELDRGLRGNNIPCIVIIHKDFQLACVSLFYSI